MDHDRCWWWDVVTEYHILGLVRRQRGWSIAVGVAAFARTVEISLLAWGSNRIDVVAFPIIRELGWDCTKSNTTQGYCCIHSKCADAHAAVEVVIAINIVLHTVAMFG